MDDGWTRVQCDNCGSEVIEADLTAWGQCAYCEREFQEWEAANNKHMTPLTLVDGKIVVAGEHPAPEPTREEIAAAFGVEPQDIPGAPPGVREKVASLLADYYDGDATWITAELFKHFDIKEKA